MEKKRKFQIVVQREVIHHGPWGEYDGTSWVFEESIPGFDSIEAAESEIAVRKRTMKDRLNFVIVVEK